MIELIFAIVIMGFVMLSMPMLMMQIKQSSKLSSQQESIAMISSKMNLIMTQQWDDIQTRLSNQSFVVETNGVAGLSNGGPGTMRGARITFQNTRVFTNPTIQASALLEIENDAGKEPGFLMDDIDDFNNFTTTLNLQDATPNLNTDYIDQKAVIKTNVNYVSYGNSFTGLNLAPLLVGPSGGTSNIKEILGELTTTNTSELSSDTKISLRAFSVNIGGYDVETRGGI